MIGNSPTTPGPIFEPAPGPSSSETDRRIATDMARQLIAETCGDLRIADKIRVCGRHVRKDHSGDIEVVHHPGGYAYTTGLADLPLQRLVCPACSYKIRKKRALEVAAVIAAHKAAGGSILYLTLTVSHSRGEALDDVWSIVQNGFAYCRGRQVGPVPQAPRPGRLHPLPRGDPRALRLAPPHPRAVVLRSRGRPVRDRRDDEHDRPLLPPPLDPLDGRHP